MQNISFNNYRDSGFTTLSNALLANYNKLKLSDAQLLLVIQLERFFQKQVFFPSNQLIASESNFKTQDVALIVQSLIEQDYLEIRQENDETNRIVNVYDLTKLYLKLDQLVANMSKTVTNNQVADNTEISRLDQTIRQFEIEFGRMLSPLERQMVQSWFSVDHYNPEIIQLALREAVLAQVYNFKYIDRILLNWQRMNLKTKFQVERYLHQ